MCGRKRGARTIAKQLNYELELSLIEEGKDLSIDKSIYYEIQGKMFCMEVFSNSDTGEEYQSIFEIDSEKPEEEIEGETLYFIEEICNKYEFYDVREIKKMVTKFFPNYSEIYRIAKISMILRNSEKVSMEITANEEFIERIKPLKNIFEMFEKAGKDSFVIISERGNMQVPEDSKKE
jgi:hypothetical protein